MVPSDQRTARNATAHAHGDQNALMQEECREGPQAEDTLKSTGRIIVVRCRLCPPDLSDAEPAASNFVERACAQRKQAQPCGLVCCLCSSTAQRQVTATPACQQDTEHEQTPASNTSTGYHARNRNTDGSANQQQNLTVHKRHGKHF